MGPRRKILISILLIFIVILAVLQFTSPRLIPSVGTKYLPSVQYASRGSWILLEISSHGRVFFAFSIANLTYPDRKSTRLNFSHANISYAVFCLKKKKKHKCKVLTI